MNNTQTEHERICEAYLEMAGKLKYRPAAPGDGMGSISLSEEQLADGERLAEEASRYAREFIAEENTLNFRIGVADWHTNRALVYTIEAARLLCAGYCGWEPETAMRLLEMAREEAMEQWGKQNYGLDLEDSCERSEP